MKSRSQLLRYLLTKVLVVNLYAERRNEGIKIYYRSEECFCLCHYVVFICQLCTRGPYVSLQNFGHYCTRVFIDVYIFALICTQVPINISSLLKLNEINWQYPGIDVVIRSEQPTRQSIYIPKTLEFGIFYLSRLIKASARVTITSSRQKVLLRQSGIPVFSKY